MALNDISLPVSATEPSLLPTSTFAVEGGTGGPLSPFLQRLQSRTARSTRGGSVQSRPEPRQAPSIDSSSNAADTTRSTASDSPRSRLQDGSRERPSVRRDRSERIDSGRGSELRTRPEPVEPDSEPLDIPTREPVIETPAEASSAAVEESAPIVEELDETEVVATLVDQFVASASGALNAGTDEDAEPYVVQALPGTPPRGVVVSGLTQESEPSEGDTDVTDGLTDELRKLLEELIQQPLPEEKEDEAEAIAPLEKPQGETEESATDEAVKDSVIAFENPDEEQPELELSLELMVWGLLTGSDKDEPSEQLVNGLHQVTDLTEPLNALDPSAITVTEETQEPSGEDETSFEAVETGVDFVAAMAADSRTSSNIDREPSGTAAGISTLLSNDVAAAQQSAGAASEDSGESRSDRGESRSKGHPAVRGAESDPQTAALHQSAATPSTGTASQGSATTAAMRNDTSATGTATPVPAVVTAALPGQSSGVDSVGGMSSAPGRQIEISVPAGEGTNRAGSSQFADRLAQAIESCQPQSNELRVRLNPPSHGAMQIEVSMRDGELTARLRVESAQTHQLVTDTLPQLRESLSKLGTSVERIDVQLAPQRTAQAGNETDNSQDGSSRQQSSGQGSDSQQEQQNPQSGRQRQRSDSKGSQQSPDGEAAESQAAGTRRTSGVGLDRIDLVM